MANTRFAVLATLLAAVLQKVVAALDHALANTLLTQKASSPWTPYGIKSSQQWMPSTTTKGMMLGHHFNTYTAFNIIRASSESTHLSAKVEVAIAIGICSFIPILLTSLKLILPVKWSTVARWVSYKTWCLLSYKQTFTKSLPILPFLKIWVFQQQNRNKKIPNCCSLPFCILFLKWELTGQHMWPISAIGS